MRLLNFLIDKLQATFPPNRIVVLLTPIALVPASAAVTAWVAANIPGLALPEGAVAALAGAGVLSALGLVYKWLDGWQAHEQLHAGEDAEQAIAELVSIPAVREALAEVEPQFFRELTGQEPTVAPSSSTGETS